MRLTLLILSVCFFGTILSAQIPVRYEMQTEYYEPFMDRVKQFELLSPDFEKVHPNRFRRLLSGSEVRSILLRFKVVPRSEFLFHQGELDGFACVEFPDSTKLLIITLDKGGAVLVFDDGGAVFLQETLPLSVSLQN